MIRSVLSPVLTPAAQAVVGAARGRMINPSLALEFATNGYMVGDPLAAVAFSSLVTFTRASGGGRFNAQGVYEWLPADQPRIDFDPVTGQCRGLLVEEQRTNLLTYSGGFEDVSWSKSSGATIALGADDFRVLAGSGSTFAWVGRSVSVTSGAAVVFSVEAMVGTRDTLWLRLNDGTTTWNRGFNLSTGAMTSGFDGVAPSASGITPLGGGVFRCWIVATPASTSISVRLYNGGTSATSASDTTHIRRAQLEVGSFPTSYIPTTTAQVTRAADVASVNVLSPWFNSLEGTLFVEFVRSAAPNNLTCTAVSLSDGTANNRIETGERNTAGDDTYALTVAGGVVQGDTRVIVAGPAYKIALGIAPNNFAHYANGLSATDATYAIPVVDRLRIGAQWNGGNVANSHIRSIRYFPRRLSDSELQAMTA